MESSQFEKPWCTLAGSSAWTHQKLMNDCSSCSTFWTCQVKTALWRISGQHICVCVCVCVCVRVCVCTCDIEKSSTLLCHAETQVYLEHTSSACVMNSSWIVLCCLVVFAAALAVFAATGLSSPHLPSTVFNWNSFVKIIVDLPLTHEIWVYHCSDLRLVVLWGVIPCSLVNLYQTTWSHSIIDNVFYCLCVFHYRIFCSV